MFVIIIVSHVILPLSCECFQSQDVLFWTKDKHEVEIVDFLLQVNDCIVRISIFVR